MFIHVNPHNGLAIYDQVVRQIKFAVAGGTLRRGEMVPSVRELARQLAVNPNTISRAYRKLQDDEVLEAVRGTGLLVMDGSAKRCRLERTQLIRQRLREVLTEAVQSGLDAAELKSLVDRELATLEKQR